MRTRRLTVSLTAILVLGLVAFDLAISEPPNPFRAPPILAFGSGQASGGAHCAALPN
ncbi:hypothetical protein [Paracoccus zeaxanthinifaciens]|uniref:hypothetical protein n=1 Tax=Paracoccus zeaxanthinifaciens TaxID=187400 RepID=UPI0003B4A9E7|nr:hypothetical protein [Paracoccus zeaxanthinifaciens]